MRAAAPILAVTGLKREATLLQARGVIAIAGGGDSERLARGLDVAILQHRPRGLLSVGLGGALSATLRVGAWVVGEAVVCGGEHWAADAAWTQDLHAGLMDAISFPAQRGRGTARSGVEGASPRSRQAGAPPPSATRAPPPLRTGGVFVGVIAASDAMVVDAAAKAALHASTGALTVDMESHLVANAAVNHGLPFAALRVISDGADRALPKAAQAGMKKDGGMDILAVLRELAKDPRQFPALIRTGREAEVAFRALKLLRRHDLLGRLGVGDADLGQLAVDVV